MALYNDGLASFQSDLPTEVSLAHIPPSLPGRGIPPIEPTPPLLRQLNNHTAKVTFIPHSCTLPCVAHALQFMLLTSKRFSCVQIAQSSGSSSLAVIVSEIDYTSLCHVTVNGRCLAVKHLL